MNTNITKRIHINPQSKGSLGKSFEAEFRTAWLDYHDIHWNGSDLDDRHHSFADRHPEQVQSYTLGNDDDSKSTLLGLFRNVSRSDAPVHVIDCRAQADGLIVQALESLQLLESLATQGIRFTFFLFPSEDTESMNNLLELFYFAGDRVDYVIVHNPAKVQDEPVQEIQHRGRVEKVWREGTDVAGGDFHHVAGHQTCRGQGGPQVEFCGSGDARSLAFGIDAGRGNAMGDAADVPAIRRHRRFAGARATGAGSRITAGTGGKTGPPQASDAQPGRMSMDKDDLTALLVDAPAEEVDQIHRLLHEWSVGPDSSFPVQLSLLTRAQWRIAANLPRLMNDARKLIELHLAEYRRQSQAMADDFAGTVDGQNKELKKTVEIHIQATRQAAEQIQVQLADAEAVAKRVKALMESAVSEWENIKASTTAQCERLEQVSNDLQDRFAWRVMLRSFAWFLLALGYGICIGHYWIH